MSGTVLVLAAPGTVTGGLAGSQPLSSFATTTGSQELKNKQLEDASVVFVNTTDTTKQLGFSLGGSTTGTTLTLTSAQTGSQSLAIPNVSSGDSLTTALVAQNLKNKQLDDSTTKIANTADMTKQLGFSLGGSTTGTTLTLTSAQTTSRSLAIPNVGTSDSFATVLAAQDLKNKQLDDSTTTVVNTADTTKGLAFSLGGSTTGTTLTLTSAQTTSRSLAIPNVGTSDSFATVLAAQDLKNKQLDDSTTTVVNTADTTKGLAFSLGGSTTGTTLTLTSAQTTSRSLAIPNVGASDSFATVLAAQDLKNKQLDDSTTTVVNTADTTKGLAFSLGGSTTGTTLTLTSAQTTSRSLAIPNVGASDSFATVLAAQDLKNKQLDDSTTTFVNTADVTKTLAFSLGGLHTGTALSLASAQQVNTTITIPNTGVSTSNFLIQDTNNAAQTANSKLSVNGQLSLISASSDAAGSGIFAIQNGVAFVADNTNSLLRSLSVQNPAQISLLNTVGGASTTTSISLLNDLAILGYSSSVISVTNTAHTPPAFVANLTVAAGIIDLVASGRYLFAINSTTLLVYDLAATLALVSPSSISPAAHVALTVGPTPFNLIVVNGIAYVSDSTGVSVYDVSTPTSTPTLLASIAVSGGARRTFVSGIYLYIAIPTSPGNVYILNVTNPSSPAFVTAITSAQLNGAIDCVVLGNRLYVAAPTASILAAYDVTNPSSPITLTALSTSVGLTRLAVSGTTLFGSASGAASTLYAYDTNSLNTPAITCGALSCSQLVANNDSAVNGTLTVLGSAIVNSFASSGNSSVNGQLLTASQLFSSQMGTISSQTPLTAYIEATFSTTWSFNGGGGMTLADAGIHMTRFGRMVTLTSVTGVTVAPGTATATALVSNTPMDAAFRPTSSNMVNTFVDVINAGVVPTSPGIMVVGTNGILSIYLDTSQVTHWTNASTGGYANFTVTYTIF